MPNCQIDMQGCTDRDIAKNLRQMADKHDPWGGLGKRALFFVAGMLFIAALDYGDVHICVGDCDGGAKGPNRITLSAADTDTNPGEENP